MARRAHQAVVGVADVAAEGNILRRLESREVGADEPLRVVGAVLVGEV